MTTIQATMFVRPNGDRKEITIKNINPCAAKYINDNGIKVSLEEIGMDTAVYFDDGTLLDDEETPDELIYIVGNRTCEELMDKAVEEIKKRKAS